MDKDYSKVIFTILALFLILILGLGIKELLNRREVSKLLLVKSASCTVEPLNVNTNKTSNTSISKNDNNNGVHSITNGNIASSDNPDKDSENKIMSSSSNVEKKVQTGMDLISNNESTSGQEIETNNYNGSNNLDNIQLLARLIQSEAEDEPYQGKLAVGNVVLYRVNEDNTSLKDTILKKGQFDGVNTSNFNIQPSKDSIEAAKEVLNGRKVLNDGYFFVNLKMASPSWAKSSNFITRIGDHWFFRKEE